MGARNVRAGVNPGEFYLEGIGMVNLSDYTEGPIFDTEILTAGVPITAQSTVTLFANLNMQQAPSPRKLGVETNMTQSAKLPAQWEMYVQNIHLGIIADTEIPIVLWRQIMMSAYGIFRLNNQRNEREAPIWYFGFPYGTSGTIALDGAGGPIERTILNNGVTSGSATPRRLPLHITSAMTFDMTVRFDRGFTPGVTVYICALLNGFIKKQVM